jgi:hypothetical protein
VGELAAVRVAVGDGAALRDAVALAVAVATGVRVTVALAVREGDAVALAVAVCEGEGVAVIVAVGVAVSVAVAGGGATQFEPSQNELAKKTLPAVQSLGEPGRTLRPLRRNNRRSIVECPRTRCRC